MYKCFTLFACLMLGMAVWAQSPTEEGDQVPCLGDILAQSLRDQYPNGVPGRKLPADIPVSKVDSAFTYLIPVVVHVMHSYGPERNVSPLQIQSLIDILNEGFGRYGEGANSNPLGGDVKIRFCLASVDPDGNPHPGYDYTATEYASSLNPLTEDTLMKRINQWDPNRYVNIWTVRQITTDGSTFFDGYTYIPEQVAGSAYDGIVLQYRALGRDAGVANSRGKTGTHEMGHYFDLYHPWGDEATQDCRVFNSDYCDDTPPVATIEFTSYPGCLNPAINPGACDGGLRQLENYMDYSQDECLNLFTHCQIDRMRTALLRWRSEMVSSTNLHSTGCGEEMLEIPAQGQIFVYPNPANQYMFVNVDVENVGPTRLEMFDFAGRRVMVREVAATGRGPISLDLSEFAQGSYYLKVITSTVSLSTKVFVGRFEE